MLQEGIKIRNRVTDNLGARYSPLIRIKDQMGNPGRATQLYNAPQLEFIWRRTKLTTSYTESKLVDSVDRANRANFQEDYAYGPSMKEVIPFNVYDVHLGILGALLKHENKYISISLQTSLGCSFSYIALQNSEVESILHINYEQKFYIFCFARAWITEPTSGLTFGAEVYNNFLLKNSQQPYFNVTLSKALNPNKLGAIFQPITAR